MLEDILLVLSVAAVMASVGLSLRRLDRLLWEGKAARRRGYRPPVKFYDHRESTPEQTGPGRRDSAHRLFKPFLLR